MKTVRLLHDRFQEMLIETNGLDQMRFKRWVFCPGMEFNSMKKWWGDYGLRDFPHEGVDFCLYQDDSNRILRLNEKNWIPVIYDGVVKTIFKDYLGQAVIIEHDHLVESGRKVLSIYAHTNPRPHIQAGVGVYEGEIIASLADTSGSKANIIPHLHFSMGLPSSSLLYEAFFWNIIRKPDLVTLLDPLDVLDIPCQVLNPDEAYCFQLQ